MGAPVAWFDIAATDPKPLIEFYGELFGWDITDGPESGYYLVSTGAGENAVAGGIGATQSPDDPGGVTIYMHVDDLQTCLDKAERLGAKTVLPPTDLPGEFGRFALFADPAGHTIGLWS
jgi:predicted enzyme related to lactoylglutathione lyase